MIMATTNSISVVVLVIGIQSVIGSSITTTESSSEFEREIRQMRIELCASEIDRNKIASALTKFNKFPDGEQVIKDIVKYYIENHQENFDNLLVFLNEVKSNVKQTSYQTLFELSDLNIVGVPYVLHMYSFIKQNHSENEVYSNQFYKTVETVTFNALKKADLTELVNFASDNRTKENIKNLVPLIVRSIYNNNPDDITKLLQLSSNFKNFTQKVKVLHLLLKQALPDNNTRHLFLIFDQIKAIKKEVSNRYDDIRDSNICLLLSLEKDIPDNYKPYMSHYTTWNIKSIFNNQYLHWYTIHRLNSKWNFW